MVTLRSATTDSSKVLMAETAAADREEVRDLRQRLRVLGKSADAMAKSAVEARAAEARLATTLDSIDQGVQMAMSVAMLIAGAAGEAEASGGEGAAATSASDPMLEGGLSEKVTKTEPEGASDSSSVDDPEIDQATGRSSLERLVDRLGIAGQLLKSLEGKSTVSGVLMDAAGLGDFTRGFQKAARGPDLEEMGSAESVVGYAQTAYQWAGGTDVVKKDEARVHSAVADAASKAEARARRELRAALERQQQRAQQLA